MEQEKNVKICIVDSGIDLSHSNIDENRILSSYTILLDTNNEYRAIEGGLDNIGHGTAICSIIMKLNKKVTIYNIKIFDNELICSEQTLIFALTFIEHNIECDIVHLSLGITKNSTLLYDVCLKLYKKGILIVSAFDNNGAISYPASYDFVIGVDSGFDCRKYNDFEFVENSIVNVLAFGNTQRVAWVSPKFMIVSGASFAAAYITAFIVDILNTKKTSYENILSIIKDSSKKVHTYNIITAENKKKLEIEKAIVFPYNKEIHSLINYTNLLTFKILGVYDYRKLGNIGRIVTPFDNKNHKYTINNIDFLDWTQEFDTVILGHMKELEAISNDKILHLIVDKCLQYKKNIYSFDNLSQFSSQICNRIEINYPSKSSHDLPKYGFGKLHKLNTPILGVFGTSSQQGKYTLQLELRKKFLENGYKIGQLGTEPSALLFGMNEVFPMGYGSTVNLNQYETILMLNEIMHRMDDDLNDIIIVGSQSGTVAYANYNISLLPLTQIYFLYGTQPDAVILCINPFDDYDYISRTIKAIEGIGLCKVISLVIFPKSFTDTWSHILNNRKKLDDNKLDEIKSNLKIHFKLPCYILGRNNEIEDLFSKCINFFSED